MSTQLIRRAIKTEIERARAAWTAYPLRVDYENKRPTDLATLTNPYLLVDITFRDGTQLDLGQAPILRSDGQIILAVGVKEDAGTDAASELLDFLLPYLQLRDDLLHGVRTSEAKPHPPRPANGYYYLPAVVGFWRDAVKPPTP